MDRIGDIAATLCATVLRSDDAMPNRVVHDSRLVQEGDLFVALRGAHADGHAFLDDAFGRGACGALVSDPSRVPANARNLIVVDDTLDALQQLASTWRRRLDGTIIGITGSNGKTTTRALLAHLLQSTANAGAVYTAPKNYNTEVGLPLALLAMPITASIGLFELGTELPGDIATLADLLEPEIGLITSIGPSHLDGFGSIDAVAAEKWTLVERLPMDGLAILNADAPALRLRAPDAECRCVTAGLENGEIRGRVESNSPSVRLAVSDPPMQIDCPILGTHNATNLLLAAVAAHRLGVPPHAIEERAKSFEPVPHRLCLIGTSFGMLLDDTYNANPASTAGALRTLARLGEANAHRTFVFGEMRDLGPDTDRYHREALDLAIALGIDTIHPVGERAVAACRTHESSAIAFVEREALSSALRIPCSDGRQRVVLLKGSRSLELDRLVGELLALGP
jgi:UDP-N-acetylmuramoyl-tripeptide--D-alanyl-D-alanine ligase